jgi:hypothetical protein
MKNLLLLVLLSLLTLPLAHAQKLNQSYVITAGFFLNMFKLPEELVWAITSPTKRAHYREMVETTHAKMNEKNENLTCEQKCFDDLRILADARNKMIPDSGENLLSFLNEKKDFADHIQRTVGYCWGHSSVTRNFNYLAHFDGSASKENLEFYKKKIRRIMRGKAENIPGYANLREFSAAPEIKKLLKDQVVWKWLDKSLRVRSIKTSTTGLKGLMVKEELLPFLAQLKEKLAVNHVPKIFFSNLKKPGFIHIVNVYNIVEEENQVKLCILDNHQYEDELKDCGVYVSVKLDGSENFYEGWNNPARGLEGFVGQFGYTPEDDFEILKFQKQNQKMCIEQCKEK